MSDDTAMVPVTEKDLAASGLPSLMKMSPGLALYFNDAIYNRVKQMAGHMAKADGATPKHLLGKPETCFAVITRAITWNLEPSSVAAATWSTPSGQIGYEAKLIVAIMENSGALIGRLKYEYKGDWSKLRGKYKIETSGKGNKYPVSDWDPKDEKGLSIVVSCQIKGETERREEEFWLEELWPRNSTLWATRPRQQATYAVSRAFASIATPALIMGLPFDVDPGGLGNDDMVDITPARPKASEFERHPVRDNPALAEFITKANFANTLNDVGTLRKEGLAALPAELHGAFEEVCDARARQITASEAKTDGPNKDGEPEEGNGDPRDEQEEKAKDEEPAKVETPFQRGQRLLTLIKEPVDVRDVMETIGDELKGKELKLWNDLCQARFAELGGAGKIKTGP